MGTQETAGAQARCGADDGFRLALSTFRDVAVGRRQRNYAASRSLRPQQSSTSSPTPDPTPLYRHRRNPGRPEGPVTLINRRRIDDCAWERPGVHCVLMRQNVPARFFVVAPEVRRDDEATRTGSATRFKGYRRPGQMAPGTANWGFSEGRGMRTCEPRSQVERGLLLY